MLQNNIDNYLWTKFRMPNVYSSSQTISEKADKTILISLPLTWETLCLIDSIKDKFKKIIVVPLTSGKNSSLQDGVFKYLHKWKIRYFREANNWNRKRALKMKPDIIIDCVFTISKFGFENNLIDPKTLIIEDTRTGGEKLREYLKEKHFTNNFFVLDDSFIKKNYENKMGIGYSVVGALIANGVLLTGKKVLVVGFGPVGQGVARYCKGLGAIVSVVDINEDALIGAKEYHINTLDKAITDSDVVITATGRSNVINSSLLAKCKDGLILANAGADFGEWDQQYLKTNSKETRYLNNDLTLYVNQNGNKTFELGGGNSLNLTSGISVSEFLDLTFSLGIRVIQYYIKNGSNRQEIVLPEPIIQDLKVYATNNFSANKHSST